MESACLLLKGHRVSAINVYISTFQICLKFLPSLLYLARSFVKTAEVPASSVPISPHFCLWCQIEAVIARWLYSEGEAGFVKFLLWTVPKGIIIVLQSATRQQHYRDETDPAVTGQDLTTATKLLIVLVPPLNERDLYMRLPSV
jgi:hypothetical protein